MHGGLVQASKDKWAAWTGGNPIQTGLALIMPASFSFLQTSSIPPTCLLHKKDTTIARKFEVKYTKGDDLALFQKKEWAHMIGIL
jgi:hypothetical protein